MIEKLKSKLRLSLGLDTNRETRHDITELAQHHALMYNKINELIDIINGPWKAIRFPIDCSHDCKHYSEIDMGIYCPESHCDQLKIYGSKANHNSLHQCPIPYEPVNDSTLEKVGENE